MKHTGEKGAAIARLGLYDSVASEASALVIRRYSTSFGLASRLLDESCRRAIEEVYALVRVADEIVDGGATEAGLDTAAAGRLLDAFEAETERALVEGYSANLVVHAFATVARRAGFGAELTRPFFASMRADLHEVEHDPESFARYVYGSAEVVGLMCLRVFLIDHPRSADELARLERGACALGAAFQKVNFLRDLAADAFQLGRSYFPGVDAQSFDEAVKLRLVDDIDDDLAAARATLPLLPVGSRRAVALAEGLFAELNARIRRTPANELLSTRIRVPDPVKLRIAAGVVVRRGMPKRGRP
ncbi:squalene/phytoene synthase family protein [Homoserinibacter sp. GY 40078]|uniref:phytoene/squalene synthase family protein n=1 Tax=Homoserinibacter sp. GY 40078 TaxID=2603275 RepID=UPI0011CBE51A|nr:squalene/phytoene synthase family protein [Homoserinibacter sp. GY 40078]TXK18978.1 phytoene/squalene synthase family protein [Homoserinibacter sp. GY 40078]